jgi:hypothetical protein
MSKKISIRIDVTKIDKSALYPGQKGKYLDAIVYINDQTDQHGQYGGIQQDLGKEAREAGRKNYIGNVRKVWDDAPQAKPPVPKMADNRDDTDDLPF